MYRLVVVRVLLLFVLYNFHLWSIFWYRDLVSGVCIHCLSNLFVQFSHAPKCCLIVRSLMVVLVTFKIHVSHVMLPSHPGFPWFGQIYGELNIGVIWREDRHSFLNFFPSRVIISVRFHTLRYSWQRLHAANSSDAMSWCIERRSMISWSCLGIMVGVVSLPSNFIWWVLKKSQGYVIHPGVVSFFHQLTGRWKNGLDVPTLSCSAL